MQLEHLDPRSLKPHPQNSRKHSDEQLQQLMQSIERFGFNGAVQAKRTRGDAAKTHPYQRSIANPL